MICKKCKQEIPEQEKACPFCGEPVEMQMHQPEEITEEMTGEVTEEVAEEVTEETVEEITEEGSAEAEETTAGKQKKKWPKILAIAGGAVVLLALIALLTGFILNSLGILDLSPRGEGVAYKDVYTVTDEKAVKKAEKTVATIGTQTLTNGELQLYYQNEIYNFLNQYYYYMSFMGLDITQPLDQQPCAVAEGLTWEQYFLQSALKSWEQYALLCMMAEDAGHQVDPELLSSLDGIPAQLESYAVTGGFESADAYISENAGVNVTVESYVDFNRAYFIANDYMTTFYSVELTVEELENYYTANEVTFAANSITRDMGLNASVRHILIAPEGGTVGEDGTTTYSQEEWDAALAQAQALLDSWKAGEATEESFIAMTAENTDDPGVAQNGGLYENINADASYLPEFLAWATDSARKTGDTDIVKTSAGYHIMYFVSGEDYWMMIVKDQMISDRIKAALEAAQEKYPAKYHYKRIALSAIDLY